MKRKSKTNNSAYRIVLMQMLLVFSIITVNAQDAKKENETKTKMEMFSSKTGVITKFTDFQLPNLPALYTSVETRIRVLKSGNNNVYFYQIEKEGKYNSTTASIEYSDLLEVIKALKTLKSEVDTDIQSNPDYLENKFITTDGFQIGYYVSKGKSTWYIRLEKYGSDNTLFFNSVAGIEQSLENAKTKIDELKNNH